MSKAKYTQVYTGEWLTATTHLSVVSFPDGARERDYPFNLLQVNIDNIILL